MNIMLLFLITFATVYLLILYNYGILKFNQNQETPMKRKGKNREKLDNFYINIILVFRIFPVHELTH